MMTEKEIKKLVDAESLFGDEDYIVRCYVDLNIRAPGEETAKDRGFKRLKGLLKGVSNNGFGIISAEHVENEC